MSDEPLARELWLPSAGEARRVVYSTVGPAGQLATSSGAVFLPAGSPPAGGWPMVAWAHGTAGLADVCAPSSIGPLLPSRDRPYLDAWLQDGYAVVASDYTGLGTPGVSPYLNGRVTAENIVDMVAAVAQGYATTVSRRWVVVGQSQGGAAALQTARYATSLGGGRLDYRGAVATGVPAYIEHLIALLGPGIPPFKLSPQLTSYTLYILAGLRASRPLLDLDRYLTPKGRRYVALAEQLCALELKDASRNVVIGALLRRPLAALPGGGLRVLQRYMGLPERGYDRPIFVGQGIKDTDVPTPLTLTWASAMAVNRQPLTLRVYPGDHSATLSASLKDSRPFVAKLLQAR